MIFFLYLAFKGIDFAQLWSILVKANYFIALVAVLIGAIFGSWIRAIRWRYFLYPVTKPLNIHLKVSDMFSAIMVGYFFNILIPRAGEFSRPFLFAQKYKISKAFTLGTIVVERIFDMLSMFFVFGICLFFFRDKMNAAFGQYNIENISLYFSVGMILIVIIIAIMLFNFEKSEKFIEKISKKILPQKYQSKVQKILISLLNGFLFIKYPKYYWKIFVLTGAIWVVYAIGTFILFFAFKDPVLNNLSFLDANLVLTLTAFAQTLPLPGNSAGTFHLFTKSTLNIILGVDAELATAYGTVNHALGTLVLIITGFYYSVKENYKFSMRPKSASDEEDSKEKS